MAIGKISDILVRRGVIAHEALQAAEVESTSSGVRLEKLLLEKNLVSPADMTLALSEYLGMPPISLAHFTPTSHLMELIAKETLIRHRLIPIAKLGNSLTVA